MPINIAVMVVVFVALGILAAAYLVRALIEPRLVVIEPPRGKLLPFQRRRVEKTKWNGGDDYPITTPDASGFSGGDGLNGAA